MTETPHEISSRLSPLRDKIINPATRGLRPRFARNYLFSILTYFDAQAWSTGQSSSENVFFLSFSSLDSAINSPTDVEVKSDEEAGEIAFEEFKEMYKITLFHIS